MSVKRSDILLVPVPDTSGPSGKTYWLMAPSTSECVAYPALFPKLDGKPWNVFKVAAVSRYQRRRMVDTNRRDP